MWLRNHPKTVCTALSLFQMSNHIAKFNTWKFAARWILCQHNINAITTYLKYNPPVSYSGSQGALPFLMTKSIFPGALSLRNLTESRRKVQKQPSREVFLGKVVLKICIKFTGKYLCWSTMSIKVQSNFTEIRFWQGCSPVNLLHIFRTAFYKNTYGGLPVKVAF